MCKRNQKKGKVKIFANGYLDKYFSIYFKSIHLIHMIISFLIFLRLRYGVCDNNIVQFAKDTQFQINQQVLNYHSIKAPDWSIKPKKSNP